MKILFLIVTLGFLIAAKAPVTNDQAGTMPLVVSFASECCGVPSEAPLYTYIRSFRKKYKLRPVSFYKAGPLGREGEYKLGFPLKGFTRSQKAEFIRNVTRISKQKHDKGNMFTELNTTWNTADFPERATIKQIVL